MEWTAQRIEDGHSSEWTVCNCVSYIKVKTYNTKLVKGSPQVGGVVEFDYNGTPHQAFITSLEDRGFNVSESNYKPCLVGTRFISWNDPHITQFLMPANQ